MSCSGCSSVPIIDGRNPIIDVQNIIEDWAWEKYRERMGMFTRFFMKKKDFEIEVPMNYYQFEDGPPQYGDLEDAGKRGDNPGPPDEEEHSGKPGAFNGGQTDKANNTKNERPMNGGSIDTKPDLLKVGTTSLKIENASKDPTLPLKPKSKSTSNFQEMDDVNPNVSILSTVYKNDTNIDQTYKFRIERTRKAAVNITFQRGFSVGGSAKLKLPVFDAEVNTKYEVTKTTGETFEQTLTFETNSDVTVEKNSNCIARVYFSDKPLKRRFTVTTLMSMPSRSAPVFIRRRKNDELVAMLRISDLKFVFGTYEQKGDVKLVEEEFDDPDAPDGKMVTHNVQITTTGILDGIRLAGQTVELQTVDLANNPVSKTLNEGLVQHNASLE